MPKEIKNLEYIVDFLNSYGINIPLQLLPSTAWLEIYRKPKITNRENRRTIVGIGSAFEEVKIPTFEKAVIDNRLKRAATQLVIYKDRLNLSDGACPDNSVSSILAMHLKSVEKNIPVLGISPRADYQDLIRQHPNPHAYDRLREIHDFVLWTGYGPILETCLKYQPARFAPRDLLNILVGDAIIGARGSKGSAHEYFTAFEMAKPVGALKGTGGITDNLQEAVLSFKQDGKDNVILFYEDSPEEIVAKLMAQIEVDNYLMKYSRQIAAGEIGAAMTTVDIYRHSSTTRRMIEPIANAWKIQMRPEEIEKGWHKAKDRKLPFVWYARDDMTPQGKIILPYDRKTAVEYIQDMVGEKVTIAHPRKPGETGLFLFPFGIPMEKFNQTMQEISRTAVYSKVD